MSAAPGTPALKTRRYEYSTAGPDLGAVMRLSGLEYMRALAAGELGARPSISDTIGMSNPMDLDYGKVTMEADPGDHLLNPVGTVHGGFACTVLDSVMGIAVHTTLEPGFTFGTAELKVHLTRPILRTTGRLRAEGSIIHVGRQMATSEGRLFGVEDGKLYAHGTCTCFISAIPPRQKASQ